jgi:hypothetical protein
MREASTACGVALIEPPSLSRRHVAGRYRHGIDLLRGDRVSRDVLDAVEPPVKVADSRRHGTRDALYHRCETAAARAPTRSTDSTGQPAKLSAVKRFTPSK